MAPILRHEMVSFLLISTYYITLHFYYVNTESEPMRNCTSQDFVPHILRCDPTTNMRKVVFYLNADCIAHYHEQPFETPCQCDPGYGETVEKESFSCDKCQPGEFSPGGEIINDWRSWNKSGIPGLYLNADTYCSDFLTGRPCNSWKMGGNGEFLVSGDYKNATELLCFEQSILSYSRHFYNKKDQNQLKFLYKVDGAPCRRGATVCSHGLHVFVNEIEVLHSDVQFQWKEHTVSGLQQGNNRFKFVYHRSCTRDAVLDVAYVKHISMFGTDTPNASCRKCPPGTYSTEHGSVECEKCIQNEYQNASGRNSCLKCPINHFSRIGATECQELPYCTIEDYYLLPKPVNLCTKNASGAWVRDQTVSIPKWPGIGHDSCVEKKDGMGIYKKPIPTEVLCQCQPGYFLDVKSSKKACKKCNAGEYSDGAFTECRNCGKGTAAIPGFYWEDFSDDSFPQVVDHGCSGTYCKEGEHIWLPRGNYLATRRLPGNFEAFLNFTDIHIDYFDAKIEFNCSVDCRMDSTGKQLAKHDHCFLKTVIMKGNETVYDTDCVSRYLHELRNGTIMRHEYLLKDPGNYSFFTLFHHEDEANFSLVSYEARIHFVRIFGATHGVARECTVCPAGTKVSKDQAFCEQCPNGTYSVNGSNECTPCPEGHFSNKEGSASCIPCGSGTIPNAERDGCDYRNCTFSPKEGIMYDLLPLKIDGGSMYPVRSYKEKTRYYFPLLYFINICSTNHDNSSCMVNTRRVDPSDTKAGLKIVKQTYLKTMACKRWSFDEHHSYSIGEVLNFLPLKDNIKGGLMINLTGGYNCWHKGLRIYMEPSTSIMMLCDLTAGIGQPEPRSNFTAIDEKHCHFELTWRTAYACPLCTALDYSTVSSECKNGIRYVTKTRTNHCHSRDGTDDITFQEEQCTENKTINTITPSTKNDKSTSSHLTRNLTIVVVVAVLVIFILISFVVYFARRNRDLRTRIFVPGKSFSKVQDEDEDELVDHMQF